MKKLVVAVGMLILLVSPALAFDASWLNSILFVNDTGYTIEYLFLSPGDSSEWGPEILGHERTLYDGDSLGFYVLYPDECDTFDILAIDDEGDSYIIWDYEICDGDNAVVVLDLDMLDFDNVAPDFQYVTLEIQNTTDYEMWYVFMSPTDSEYWGVDLLDEDSIIAPGDTATFLVPVWEDTVEYDFKSVDEDSDEYEFSLTIDPDEGDEQFVQIEMSDLQ